MKFIVALLASAAAVYAHGSEHHGNNTVTEFGCLTESELDAKIPKCAQQCQQAALAQDGCKDYEDIACHCSATGAIGAVLGPCLINNSTCTQKELTELENLITPICTYFNATTSGELPPPECPEKHKGGKHHPHACKPYTTTAYGSYPTGGYKPNPTGAYKPHTTGGYFNATPSSPVKFLGAAPASHAVSGLLAMAGLAAALVL